MESDNLDFKKYCYNHNSFDFKIDDFDFICEETTTGEEALFFNYYIEPNGLENQAKLGLVRATKLKKTPFTQEWIKHLIGVDNQWSELTLYLKLSFLEKLESKFAGKILSKINNHYKDKETQLKN